MAKQFVLYNLKDNLNDEDFLKFINEFKGPFVSGLSAVNRYTITRVKKAMQETEDIYLKLLETSSPQAARTVLPNSCKTELITFASSAQRAIRRRHMSIIALRILRA